MDKPLVPTKIRRIFEGRVFTVQVETIALPTGAEVKAEIIDLKTVAGLALLDMRT